MCNKSALRTQLSALFGLLVAGSFVLFGLGAWMIVDSDGHIAYGNQVKNWGGGYVFIGLLLIFMIGFGLFGSRRHNKFALALAMCTNCFALFVLFVVVITIFSQVAPAFPVSVANECVTRATAWAPLTPTCKAYFDDKGNNRLFRLWLTQYQRSVKEPIVRATMLGIEDANFCCGWGPPIQCKNANGGNFSADGVELETSNVPVSDAMERCSRHLGWYQVGLYCRKVDGSGFAGCPYMFSQSSICISDLTTRGGCAGAYQTILSSRFNGIAGGGVAVLFIQMIAMLSMCCYCFKRKYTDVLPPYEPFSAKEYEKYRFGVAGQNAPVKVNLPDEPTAVPIDDGVVVAGDPNAKPAAPALQPASASAAGTGLAPIGEAKSSL